MTLPPIPSYTTGISIPSTCMHAFQKLNDKEEAQDVVHELFTQLWNKRRELDIHTNLMGYLYMGVRNKESTNCTWWQ